jgi:hypothetical protein
MRLIQKEKKFLWGLTCAATPALLPSIHRHSVARTLIRDHVVPHRLRPVGFFLPLFCCGGLA